ncbi:helix-turn-helix domain-containing protein [Zhihengliuella sp.]|uniref:TetR/AcrR family transcriptional regulator n=1 Tax=Zhihengliuella sp. TaxID=1954483 RepID=UPI0028118DAC|nr:helix-turn-helix domain-containing protein [Zhihengliuella sp.]
MSEDRTARVDPDDGGPASARDAARDERRQEYLAAAARLFAERGYRGVSIEDLGAACGVSGPAVYRYFRGKQAVLAALLVGVSESLLEGSRAVVEDADGPATALQRLIEFQADFSLDNRDVIRVQDRDLASLDDGDSQLVRRLQRDYVALWAAQLRRLHPEEDAAAARQRAHAAFGLLNSTPHSGGRGRTPGQRSRLVAMAWAAVSARVP